MLAVGKLLLHPGGKDLDGIDLLPAEDPLPPGIAGAAAFYHHAALRSGIGGGFACQHLLPTGIDGIAATGKRLCVILIQKLQQVLPHALQLRPIALCHGGAVPAACDYRPSGEPVWLSERCVFLGEIPAAHDFEQRRPLGRVLLDEEEQPDLLTDDTALACKTPAGLFIVTGCSHSGICNIVSRAQAVCGETRIAGILGGFHLPKANSRVQKTAEFLAALHLRVLYPCHCVSLAAKLELAKVLPVQETGSGMCIELS